MSKSTYNKDLVGEVGQLNDSFPILMFPLRLETRFKTIGGGQSQLWLRVYPDDCNVTIRQDLLSESELSNAHLFWIEIWKAGGNESEERGAWRSLVNSHGVGRATWIVRQYAPRNEKPIKPTAKHIFLVVTSAFEFQDTYQQMTANEYWISVFLANGNQGKIEEAFSLLKTNVGEQNANEIVKKYVPENIDDELPDDTQREHIQIQRLELPTDKEAETEVSWSSAPKATALPDHFVAIAFTGDQKRSILFDNPLQRDLSVGPDPSLGKSESLSENEETGELIVNEELKWMVDFEKAVEVGMGAKINLSQEESINGFDKLFVIGIRTSSNELESKELLEELLANHFYSNQGLELLKQGTSTNNTEDESAGYSWSEDSDESFERVFKGYERFESESITSKQDGQVLADGLGIDTEFFRQVAHANGRDQLEAKAMNRALYPATLGYFLEEMLNPLATEKDIAATEYFFSTYVSGRGAIPSIRIGRQPYGIIPVSVFSRMKFTDELISIDPKSARYSGLDRLDAQYLNQLHELLHTMDSNWDKLIPELDYIGKEGDAHQVLLNVIGLQANSVEFHQRYSQSLAQLYNQIILQGLGTYAGEIVKNFLDKSKNILKELGIKSTENIPLLEKVFLNNANLLSGDIIDDTTLSETEPIRPYTKDEKNYIEWLASANVDTIRTMDFGGKEAPNALLFLLLRHALMLSHADTATKLLRQHKFIFDKSAYFDPDFLHLQKDSSAKSKFEHLYGIYPEITNSSSLKLGEYIYENQVLNESFAAIGLKEQLDALKLLEKLPTARLERLFVEHIDCCNYRIDAWKLGLINYRLNEQRALQKGKTHSTSGLYLGAYGWLLNVKPKKSTLKEVQIPQELRDFFNEEAGASLFTDEENLGYIHAPSLDQAATAAILRNAYDSYKDGDSNNPFEINLSSERVRIAINFLEGMRNGQSLAALLGYQFERGLHDKYSLGKGEVDQFIYPLRKAFPLVADKLKSTQSESSTSIEFIEANNVIDGLLLINHVQGATEKSYPFGLQNKYHFPDATTQQIGAINDEVERLITIHDAISDLVISEQMYQVVQNNFQRAAGNADAFSKGDYPPQMDIINTPRSGITLTQRMAIQFNADADSKLSPYGAGVLPIMTPRAAAEPSVNEWLSGIMPSPDKVLCKVVYDTPHIENQEIEVSQADLGLQPMDLLYCFDFDTEQATKELDDRLVYHVRKNIAKHAKTKVSIKYTKEIDKDDRSKISFFELAALVKSLQRILIGSRYLTASEIITPEIERNDKLSVDNEQLKKRIEGIREGLKKVIIKVPVIDSIDEYTNQLRKDLQQQTPDSSTLDDLLGIDDLIISMSDLCMEIAFYDNSQTSIDFVHQTVSDVYDRIFANLEKIQARWYEKQNEFVILQAEYTLEKDEDVDEAKRISLLSRMEDIVSTTHSYLSSMTENEYKVIVDTKKDLFDQRFEELKDFSKKPNEKIIDFIKSINALIERIKDHDFLPFDNENNRNDLLAEKLKIAFLKSDIKKKAEDLKLLLADKIKNIENLCSKSEETVDSSEKTESLLKASKVAFGDEALVLPHFKFTSDQAKEIKDSFLTSNDLLDFVKVNEERAFPVEDWLNGVARVRENVYHWEKLNTFSQAFRPESTLEIVPLQFPFQEDDRWLAMNFKNEQDDFKINGDKLLYTVHFAKKGIGSDSNFDEAVHRCGILIDEWIEVIPSDEETTGIAFQFDQPASEPAQAMLLVTPPLLKGNWEWDDIVDSIEETLDMVKKRAVEPAHIEKTAYAQFLPTTMMAVTLYWITVATNLSLNNAIYDKIKENGS